VNTQSDRIAIKKTAVPNPVINTKLRRRHSALSIKSLTDKRISTKKKQKEVITDISKLPSNSFTTKEIQDLWQTSIDNYNKKGEKLLSSIMSSCKPIAKENLLQLELPSELMKVDLEKAKNKILPFLREQLQNYKIDFEISVNEEVVKKFAYTPQEKFAYLQDKNELIAELKSKFNLDL